MKARRSWRFRWLELLFEFSNLEYQINLWVHHKYLNKVGWFEEDICQYFDDLYLDDHYQFQLKNGLITEEEFEAVKNFHFLLEII